MSKNIAALLITPPLFIKEFTRETEVFHGLTCTACCGNGWHWKEDKYGERYKNNCHHCGGTGKLKAVVTIEYGPDK
ncbi:hypothetical protein [Bacteroides nordii]|mgnify:CR=1 FL=1|jgi:hypothetical protein|uniref:hypothetical protein n=1 Tax=Bacteroides nordii TaxID=291645 RepID=UPI0018AA094F|nr:hypothetical protein [Bacteroides nordii]